MLKISLAWVAIMSNRVLSSWLVMMAVAAAAPLIGIIGTIGILAPMALAQETNLDTNLAWTERYIAALEAETPLVLRSQSLEVPLTRIEFAQWLVEFFGYLPDPSQTVAIRDLDPNSPDFQNAQAVVQAGVMRLFEGEEFRPTGDMTKLEALAILVRALRLPAPSADQINAWLALFSDANAVPEVGHPFIAMAGSAGLLLNVPDPAQIGPNQILRRGDGAALLHQTLVAQGRIPAIEPPVAQLAPAAVTATAPETIVPEGLPPSSGSVFDPPPPVPGLPLPGTTAGQGLISAFRVFPSAGVIFPNQQLQLGIQGIPGGLARAEIGGIGVIQLQETSPGIYLGTYTVTERVQPVQGTEVRVELLFRDQRDQAQQRFPDLILGSAAVSPTPVTPAPVMPAPAPVQPQVQPQPSPPTTPPQVQSNRDLGLINSIQLQPQRDLQEGDILTVQMQGRRGGVARFDLGNQALGIPMRPVRDSGEFVIYEGTYVVAASDRLIQPQVRIRLTLDETQEISTTFAHNLDGSVGTRSTIQPPPVPISANPPRIEAITSSGAGVTLRPNDLLQVTVRGDRGARGSFRVAGVIPDTELREISPGVYEGQVRIPPNPPPVVGARLEVTLDRDGQRTIQADPNPLTIVP